jgi:hypothetical protein
VTKRGFGRAFGDAATRFSQDFGRNIGGEAPHRLVAEPLDGREVARLRLIPLEDDCPAAIGRHGTRPAVVSLDADGGRAKPAGGPGNNLSECDDLFGKQHGNLLNSWE